MRLLQCHIEHFGKFSDYTVDFAENPCVFKEPNGWGKSTLAAFIKVMFYGFANEKKRGDVLERERVRYRPWQGGVCGGELYFEANGKKYLLNRTFGRKEAEDTFVLYDASTNLVSNDFTANIGEELFQINQESFLRTVFIGQNDCDTAATDSINAKIGNLADCLDDMNHYEAVQQTLKDLRNSLTPSRKTGLLKKQREEIAQLRDELRRAESVGQAAAELEGRLEECREERESLQAERSRLQEAWETVSGQMLVAAKRTHYASILQQLEEKKEAVDRALGKLGGNPPDEDTLHSIQGKYDELLNQKSQAQANELTPSEQTAYARLRMRFAQSVPAREDIRRGQELLLRLEDLRSASVQNGLSREERQEYRQLQERFAGFPNGPEGELDEAIRQWNQYLDKKNGLDTRQEMLDALRVSKQGTWSEEGNKKNSGYVICAMALAFCLLLAGGVFTALQNMAVGAGLLAIGAAVMAVTVIWLCLNRARETAERKRHTEEMLRERDKAVRLEQEIAGEEAWMDGARHYVEGILRRFGIDFAEGSESERQIRDELYALRSEWNRMRRLQARERDYQSRGYETQMRDLWEQAVGMIRPFCTEDEFSGEQAGKLGAVYSALERDLADYETLTARAERYAEAREAAAGLQKEVWQFLRNCGQEETADAGESLKKVSQAYGDYVNELRNLDRLRKERELFEASYDIRNFEKPDLQPEQSEEEIKRRMEQADDRATALLETIHSYQTQLEKKQQELDELQSQRERLVELEQNYEKNNAFYNALGLTADYMEKAKESLSARYIGPINDSFKKYYTLLAGEGADAFRMDANLHVTRRDMGELREVRAFSLGSQDLINIVLRVALVDAMYKREKPFLILDDSFVNLDDERLGKAGTFLHKIAEDYQVIYFTCHGSRAL